MGERGEKNGVVGGKEGVRRQSERGREKGGGGDSLSLSLSLSLTILL